MDIISISHKGLKKFVTHNDRSRIPSEYAEQISAMLQAINAADEIGDLLTAPGRWHPLKGGRKGDYAGRVSKNWRMTFRYLPADRAVEILDLEDYH